MNLQFVYRYILSLSKMKICFTKKEKEKENKTKGPKTKEKKISNGESRNRDHRGVKWTRYLLRHDSLHFFSLWNSAGRRCLKPVERYLWRIERYIHGKQAWFLHLKLYFNSFRRLWRTYGRQVSRNTVAKSLAACDSWRLHEENHLRFSNSKHFRF